MADKKTHSEENFFQRLISMFLGNSDPEAEKKRLLKSIAKELSRSKYKFYKFSSDEALPQLAKLFYDIYVLNGKGQKRKGKGLSGAERSYFDFSKKLFYDIYVLNGKSQSATEFNDL
jgi:hypothetical protein